MPWFDGIFTNASGLALATLSSAPLDAITKQTQVVVCLHGWLDNAATFGPLQNEIDKQDLKSDLVWVCVDFPGHGWSQHRSADTVYHHTDYVMDIASALAMSGWHNIVLVGHSMGGIVGASVCALVPDIITHFVSIEAFGPLQSPASETVSQMQKALDARIAKVNKTVTQPTSLERLYQAKMQAGKLTYEHAKCLVDRNVTKDSNGNPMWRTDPRLRMPSTFRMTPEQAQDIMMHIRCPVTFIRGDQGFTRIPEQYGQRQTWLSVPNEMHVLQGNHYVHMQQPKQILAVLQNLL